MDQLNNRTINSPRRNSYTNVHHNRKPIYIDRTPDGITLRLIKAPSVDDAAMCKGQAFNFARDRLRGNIGGSVTADSAITVFSDHFLMSAMTAEQKSRRVVSVFRSAFVQVENLKPSVFLDRADNNVTGVMCRLPCLANVYHIGVDTLIFMSDLSPAFTDGLSSYALSYFLPLPQVFQASTSFITTSTESIASPIASSIATDSNLIFILSSRFCSSRYGLTMVY